MRFRIKSVDPFNPSDDKKVLVLEASNLALSLLPTLDPPFGLVNRYTSHAAQTELILLPLASLKKEARDYLLTPVFGSAE